MEFHVPITIGKYSVCKSNHAFTDTKKRAVSKANCSRSRNLQGERLRTLNEFWLMPIPIIDGIISFIQS